MIDWEAKYRTLETVLFNSARLAVVRMENEIADDDRSYLAGYYIALSKLHLAAIMIATEEEEE